MNGPVKMKNKKIQNLKIQNNLKIPKIPKHQNVTQSETLNGTLKLTPKGLQKYQTTIKGNLKTMMK